MALADRSGLRQSDLLEVLGLGAMACPMIALKGPALTARSYPPAFKLVSQQKDMRLALALGDALDQPLPVMAAANEQFKKAKALGLGESDFAAVYEATAAGSGAGAAAASK
jgi:glyoxylate/succinic semialdehyde reductase